MPITISDIAKLANVSKSAVSIVLNNKTGVSERTRKIILETISKYNYQPNHLAKSLASKETKSIGLIIKEIDNPYSAKVMKGVFDKCSELGYSVLLGSSELSNEKETQIINALRSKRVDGIIIAPLQNFASDSLYLSNLINDKFPFVILGKNENVKINSVDINNVKAAYDAVTYLIKLGHKKILHIAGPSHSGHGEKRIEGYKLALSENNIPIKPNYIISTEPYTINGYLVGKKILNKGFTIPTAVFCYNDLLAIGLINSLLESGIKVPEDISIVGFDNIDFGKYLKIPLTTVQMPAYKIGQEAANLLVRQISNDSKPINKRVVLKHKLIKRSSCTTVRNKN
ncbi:MAG: LacI family DNA-binding transcriptional regulator [Ignavibacteriae bacterium]|nr:LacI family DNA-binding transcriptional regulator [Ignavibacteriota bacterium]